MLCAAQLGTTNVAVKRRSEKDIGGKCYKSAGGFLYRMAVHYEPSRSFVTSATSVFL